MWKLRCLEGGHSEINMMMEYINRTNKEKLKKILLTDWSMGRGGKAYVCTTKN